MSLDGAYSQKNIFLVPMFLLSNCAPLLFRHLGVANDYERQNAILKVISTWKTYVQSDQRKFLDYTFCGNQNYYRICGM